VGTPPLNLTSAQAVIEALRLGAAACRAAACRQLSIDSIDAPGRLIATGDLHDNPMHFARLVQLSGMDGSGAPASHLTLHEIIHSDRLLNGMDMSYRALAKAAALKAQYPDHVHILLGNHELAQLTNAGIVKDGVKSVEAFNAGVEYVFGADTDEVNAAIKDFIRALPIALRVHTTRGDILCAHSLPPAALMTRFDTSILSRELTDEDYQPRGAAHLMTWGRGYDAEGLEDLVERWGVWWFILGHEKAEMGVKFVPPNALILNSDHERGVYLPIDLDKPPRPEEAAGLVMPLASA
jgi:hypothetical protein